MAHHAMVLVHDFATVIWVGGMFVYVAIFLPAIQKVITTNKERKELMQKIIGRLKHWMILSTVLMSISGLVLIPTTEEGYLLFRFLDFYSIFLSIKTILSVFMIVLILLKLFKVDKIKKPEIRKLWTYRTIWTNVVLGVLVVIISIVIRGYNPELLTN